MENGSTVNIGSGITSDGVNGKIVLDGGTLNLDPDADKGVDIANLEVTDDSTIGIGENILSGASNFTVGDFINDDGNSGKNQVDVKATGVDLSGGAANAFAGLKNKMQTVMANAGITADSNFNFITDEIFAVSMQKEKELSFTYMVGLIVTPVLGWTFGTLTGAVATSLLPEVLSDAMGIALYGMFIAIIVPPMKEEKPILAAVLIASLFSCCFFYIPFLKEVPSGIVICICAIVAALICAFVFPVKEEQQNG